MPFRLYSLTFVQHNVCVCVCVSIGCVWYYSNSKNAARVLECGPTKGRTSLPLLLPLLLCWFEMIASVMNCKLMRTDADKTFSTSWWFKQKKKAENNKLLFLFCCCTTATWWLRARASDTGKYSKLFRWKSCFCLAIRSVSSFLSWLKQSLRRRTRIFMFKAIEQEEIEKGAKKKWFIDWPLVFAAARIHKKPNKTMADVVIIDKKYRLEGRGPGRSIGRYEQHKRYKTHTHTHLAYPKGEKKNETSWI